jgi:hypothetical protein
VTLYKIETIVYFDNNNKLVVLTRDS